jgi:hypothetical protein
MKIYFAWIKAKEEFKDIDLLKREDLSIFKVSLSQKEGEVALAKVWISLGHPILPLEAVIGYEDKAKGYVIFFKGRPIGFPRTIGADFAEIEFSAEPIDATEQLNDLAERLKISPYYDPLFVEAGDKNPVNVLEARQELFYWNKSNGKLSLSNLFQGERTIDLSQYVIADSLKISLGDIPYDSIKRLSFNIRLC